MKFRTISERVQGYIYRYPKWERDNREPTIEELAGTLTEKQQKALDLWEEAQDGLNMFDWNWWSFPGYVIIAELTHDGEPRLEIETMEEMVRRYESAQDIYNEWLANGDTERYSDCTLKDAYFESY